MSLDKDMESANVAIENVKNMLDLLILGPLLIKKGPRGEASIDIPLMYNGYALDRIHFDPYKESSDIQISPLLYITYIISGLL